MTPGTIVPGICSWPIRALVKPKPPFPHICVLLVEVVNPASGLNWYTDDGEEPCWEWIYFRPVTEGRVDELKKLLVIPPKTPVEPEPVSDGQIVKWECP